MQPRAPLFRNAQDNPAIFGIQEHRMQTPRRPYVTQEVADLFRLKHETVLKIARRHGHFRGVVPIRSDGKLLWPADRIDAVLTGAEVPQ